MVGYFDEPGKPGLAGEIGKVTRIWSDTVGFSRMHGVTRVGSAERPPGWLDLLGLAKTALKR
jgi:hypothetical protein